MSDHYEMQIGDLKEQILELEKENRLNTFLDEVLSERNYSPGDIVKLRREALELTQNELGKISGIKSGNISKYENGKLNIGEKVAIKFGAALGIAPRSIMFPNGKYKESDEVLMIKVRANEFFQNKNEKSRK